MQRRYFVRNKQVKLQEIEGVLAFKPIQDRGAAAALSIEALKSAGPVLGVTTGELKDFEKANWRFTSVSDEARRAHAAASATSSDTVAGRVYRRENGQIVIATQRLVVQLDPQMSAEQCTKALAERNLRLVRKLNFAPNLFEVDAIHTRDSVEASELLQGDPRFLLAEPSFVAPIAERAAPSDPFFANQWQLANSGGAGGVAGADIGALDAWQTTRGAGIRIAVIDNGFQATHEDLAQGIDPSSGFFDDNAVFRPGTNGMPGGNHGTFCAGMAAARQNNDRGGSGVAPEAQLMLIACLNDQVGSQTTLARAVAYAAIPSSETTALPIATGADIIVCSLGPNGADWALEDVLRMAVEFAASQGRGGKGCAIFWAASNGHNVDIALDEVVSLPDVIAVGRSTRSDSEHNCARGSKLEYLAPGVDVLSTRSGNGYGSSTGTSYAAPCAAGAAALALAVDPSMSRNDLRQLMIGTCDKVGDLPYSNGRNDDYGFGRISARKAVAEAVMRRGDAPPPGADTGWRDASAPGPARGPANGADVYRYEVQAATAADLRQTLDGADLDLGCRAVVRQVAGGVVMDVFATADQIAALDGRRAGSVRFTRRENMTTEGEARKREFSRQNRFTGQRTLPVGVGSKE